MLKISVHLVNGSVVDLSFDDNLMKTVADLRREGVRGKALFYDLFGDDWGVPPRGASIEGELADGTRVNEWIPFR